MGNFSPLTVGGKKRQKKNEKKIKAEGISGIATTPPKKVVKKSFQR